WASSNEGFHLALVSACGSNWLLRLRETLNAQYERYRRASVSLQRENRYLQAEHQAILAAVLERDGDTACRLLADHFDATTRALISELAG
ncbi:MAG: FCD domain-containing protein, partial [Alphaproteobacteria bacterium]|nr:FCD domain-containing protein [Alphaproteobacteria bacterium]